MGWDSWLPKWLLCFVKTLTQNRMDYLLGPCPFSFAILKFQKPKSV